MPTPFSSTATAHPVARLRAVCRDRGPRAVESRLAELEAWLADDLTALREELAAVPLESSVVGLSARHQLGLAGKLLRPLCVLLAAKLGRGFGPSARQLAVAVELIHNATLLHDDVIDLGEARRGAPAARAVYGNAASVLAGDWLLVQAIRRIRLCDQPGLLDGALAVIEKMIAAEALELENRCRLDLEPAEYFRVVDGKTAALFRFALLAGATAGELTPGERDALETYGDHLGVAFQLIDDVLDLDGDPAIMGKAALSDLREGKMTYPLLLAIERDDSLRRELTDLLARSCNGAAPPRLCDRLQRKLHSTGAVEDCRALARRHAADAVACLGFLPEGLSRGALTQLALTAVERER